MPAPTPVTRSRVLPSGLTEAEYVQSFLGAFDLDAGGAGFYRDRSGGIIALDRSLFDVRTPDGTVIGSKVLKRDRGEYMLLLAEAIKNPDEIWVDWVQMVSGIALRRSYLKRVLLPDGRELFVRFEWSKGGWSGITAFAPDKEGYLDGQRTGALIYRK